MTRAQFRSYLRELGWRLRPKIGGGNLSFEFEDRILLLDPQIWKTADAPGGFRIELNPGLTTPRFLDYCNFILQPKQQGGFAFFRPTIPMRLVVPSIDRETGFDASAKVIAWGRRLDLRDCLRSNLAYPNEAAPLFTVYRFIALRFEGRDAELQQALADVKTWSKQGYDPKITAERVERAIALDISHGL